MTVEEYYQLYGSRITQDSERLFIDDFLYPLLGSKIGHIEPQRPFLDFKLPYDGSAGLTSIMPRSITPCGQCRQRARRSTKLRV